MKICKSKQHRNLSLSSFIREVALETLQTESMKAFVCYGSTVSRGECDSANCSAAADARAETWLNAIPKSRSRTAIPSTWVIIDVRQRTQELAERSQQQLEEEQRQAEATDVVEERMTMWQLLFILSSFPFLAISSLFIILTCSDLVISKFLELRRPWDPSAVWIGRRDLPTPGWSQGGRGRACWGCWFRAISVTANAHSYRINWLDK